MSLPQYDWLIRVGSKASAGGGHVFRSQVLAECLKKQSQKCLIVLDEDTLPCWADFFRDHDFDVIFGGGLPVPKSGTIIDRYELSVNELQALSEQSPLMVLFDDLNAHPDWAHVLVNGAPGAIDETSSAQVGLIGNTYSVVNPRFCRTEAYVVAKDVSRIIVTFGMVDSKNATCKTIEILSQLSMQKIQIFVVMSRSAKHYEQVVEMVSLLANAELVVDCDDMSVLMLGSDLVIGGGGVSLLERMALGVPSITVCLADNQVANVRGSASMGGTLFAGVIGSLDGAKLASQVERLMADDKGRQMMSNKARLIIDGDGAKRIADRLISITNNNKSNGE